MYGLVLKDLYQIKKQMLIMGGIALLYLAVSLFGAEYMTMGSVVIMLFGILATTTFYGDEAVKWNEMAKSLPLTPARIVGAKYLLVILFCGIGGLLSMVLYFAGAAVYGDFSQWQLMVQKCGLWVCTVVLYNGISFPLVYRLGMERSRIPIMALGVVMVVFVISGGFTNEVGGFFELLFRHQWAVAIAALGLMAGSYLLSVKIFPYRES